jgi:hypothetical protein
LYLRIFSTIWPSLPSDSAPSKVRIVFEGMQPIRLRVFDDSDGLRLLYGIPVAEGLATQGARRLHSHLWNPDSARLRVVDHLGVEQCGRK